MLGRMAQRIDFHLTPEALNQIEQAINSAPEPEVRQRAGALHLLHQGQSPEQVAQALLVTANTIYAWHSRWHQQGMVGLRDRPRSGRPGKADSAYITQLEQLLKTYPADLGLPFTLWTINFLRLYLAEQTHILLSDTRLRSLLIRLGYHWKRPKKALDFLHDPASPAADREFVRGLKKPSRARSVPKASASWWTKRP